MAVSGLTHSTITNLKAAIPGGGSRANLFEVTLSVPGTTTITVGDTAVSSLPTGHQFWVKAGQVPGSTVSMLPVNHGGRVLKLPGLRTFDDWTCTVVNDENAQIKKFMIAWMVEMGGGMDGARDFPTSGATKGKAGYLSEDISIAQYSSDGIKKQEYTIHKAWPNAIADTPVDWGTDGLQEFTLTFSYDYFSHKKAGGTTIKLEGNTTTGAPVTSAT